MMIGELLRQSIFMAEVVLVVIFISSTSSLSLRMRHYWQEELKLRSCGRKIAALANLESAALALTELQPQNSNMFRAKLAEASLRLLPASGSTDCRSSEMKAQIYRQINPNLPDHWPNWWYSLRGPE